LHNRLLWRCKRSIPSKWGVSEAKNQKQGAGAFFRAREGGMPLGVSHPARKTDENEEGRGTTLKEKSTRGLKIEEMSNGGGGVQGGKTGQRKRASKESRELAKRGKEKGGAKHNNRSGKE